jgi:ABC-2 type transport system permease protein
MKNLWTVAQFTIKDMLSRKSFIISTIIILAIIVVAFNIPNIMNKFNGEGFDEKVLVIDSEDLFGDSVALLEQMDLEYKFEFIKENLTKEQIKEKIDNKEIDICLRFTEENGEIKMEYIVESSASTMGEVPKSLTMAFQSLYSSKRINELNITPEELAAISPQFNIEVLETDENAAKGNLFIMMMISVVLFYAIIFCAQQVSTAITTEKTSKIIETLVTSTKPSTIVLGKTLGIGLIGILQIVLIIVTAILSAHFCMDPEILGAIFDLSNITPQLVAITIVYFIFGYALYSLGFALTGSTVNKPEEVQAANTPITFIAIAGFYLAYFSMMNPSSNLNKISGLLPISSPFSMPLRVMMGTATTGELISSIAILAVTTLIVAVVSIRIYSSAILNIGTKKGLFGRFKK